MGILADFFAATPEQATRYAHRFDEADGGTGITGLLAPREYRGLTGLEISELWALLEGVPWDAKRHALPDTMLIHGGENWLERFPDALTHLLAQATQARLSQVCAEWAATEELACDPSALQPVLNDLQALAQEVQNGTGKFVYLWGSV